MKLKRVLAALSLAAALAPGPAAAGEDPALAEALQQAREFAALAHDLRTNPTPEAIRAAAFLLEMQSCYELNAAVMDATGPVGEDVQQAALACLEKVRRIASGG